MTTEHPITPPPELVEEWCTDFFGCKSELNQSECYIATQAARWGANQELEACCKVLRSRVTTFSADAFLEAHRLSDELRAARRPKPPSLKEQALEQLKGIEVCFRVSHGGDLITDTIRRALEALPDD